MSHSRKVRVRDEAVGKFEDNVYNRYQEKIGLQPKVYIVHGSQWGGQNNQRLSEPI